MTKTVLVIQHLAFEDLGNLHEVLEGAGYAIRTMQAGVDDFGLVAVEQDDLWVVLGGPIGVYESANYPFLTAEIVIIRKRLGLQLPILGICLGAQLMAAALGAAVYPSGQKEIGWMPLQLTEAGLSSPLAALAEDDGVVLHWHGDTFDLPEGAELLASTALVRHQAFRLGDYALGLQFHPEVRRADFERWLIGHADEIQHTPGVEVIALRQAAERHAAGMERRAQQCWRAWLRLLEAR